MKKILPIAIVFIIAIGGFFYFTRPNNSPAGQAGQANSTTISVSDAASWAEAIQSGRPTKCVITKDQTKMEYLIQGKKMRADITSAPVASSQKITISHMVNDEQYLYIWADGATSGSKTSLTQPTPTDNNQGSSQLPNFNSQSDYNKLQTDGYTINCQPASIDAATFAPPKDVKFVDPTEMMKQATNGQPNMQDLEEMAKKYQNLAPDNQ